MILDGMKSMTRMEVPNMTRLAQNRRRWRQIERWIISWIGLKSGSFRLRKNLEWHKT